MLVLAPGAAYVLSVFIVLLSISLSVSQLSFQVPSARLLLL